MCMSEKGEPVVRVEACRLGRKIDNLEKKMPWTAASGKTYKLCLLDTNALSEIVKRPSREGRHFVERFGPEEHVPCFTIYSLVELRRRPDVYRRFVEMFSKYPFFLLKLWEDILAQERDAYSTAASASPLLQSFTPLASNRTYGFDEFVDRLVVQEWFVDRERKWRMEEDRILDSWLANRKNFQPRRQVANAQDAERYVYEAAIQTLISFFPDWIPSFNERNEVPNVSRFPALQVMLYSQYYRLWDPDWNRRPQEVTDIRIMAAAPYVDVVITERFQNEVFKKIRTRVPELREVESVPVRQLADNSNRSPST